jgi:hypothetical protein
MFDEEAGSREGAADLKKDNWFHPRTSYESLRRFAGTMAATPVDTVKRKAREKALRDPYKRAPNKAMYWPKPSPYVQQRLDETRSWLLTHSSELPSELEDDQGRIKDGRTYFEQSEPSDDVADWDGEGLEVSKYEAHGRFHVLKQGYAEPLLSIALRKPEYRSNPTGYEARAYSMGVRGERYRKHAEAQAARLRWRGMEEFDAIEKADEKLREGVARKSSDSNAKPLPSLERLRQTYHVEAGELVNTRLSRTVTNKQVRIDGQWFVSSRIVFALTTGQDPGSLMVIDGDATSFRNAKGTVSPRTDGMFDAQVAFGGHDRVTIGEYKSEAQAQEACRLYLKSLDMGLLGK